MNEAHKEKIKNEIIEELKTEKVFVSNKKSHEILLSQVRENYGKIVYTHKIHEKDSELLKNKDARFKILQIIMSAITSAGLLAALFSENSIGVIIGAFFATFQTGLNLYLKSNDILKDSQAHKISARKFLEIREQYFSLITDLMRSSNNLEVFEKKRDELIKSSTEINKTAPSTTKKAYSLAEIALKDNEELSFSTEELDCFVGDALKISNKTKEGKNK